MGLWWDDPNDAADAFCTLHAHLNIVHVVVDVVGRSGNGALLTLSSRTSLDAPLPYQRPIRHP